MKKGLLLFLLALPFLVDAQIIIANSSFSNGSGTGSDGTTTVTTLLGSSGFLLGNDYPDLPFSQDWSSANLITVNDNWSGVTGIKGYRGDGLTLGSDPRLVGADGTNTPLNVYANQTSPNTFSTGGVAEFQISNPSVAIKGSGTAAAPFILISVNTLGKNGIRITYNLRDLDGSVNNAVQSVALQYRIGNSGNFTNLPEAYVADATTGSLATLVTPISVVLPAATNNQSLVQLRIITANAPGVDEWVGIDDIVIAHDTNPVITSFSPSEGPAGTPVTINGYNLANAAVFFNGSGADVTENSDMKIVATVPQGASNGLIAVITPFGLAKSSTNFNINVKTVITADSLALVAFYNSTNGQGWTSKTNWLTGPVSTWENIQVQDQRVVDIAFGGNNNMIGVLPNELGTLSGLTRLIVSNNAISGNIPTSLGDLHNLGALSLYNDDLEGSVPAELGNLTNLFALDLSVNNLSGNIPVSLGNLGLAFIINLNTNSFTGSVPASFKNLRPGVGISIENNNLDTLPDLSSLPNVNIYAINNRFTFEDLEPNASIAEFYYSTQQKIPSQANVNKFAGDTLLLSYAIGGTSNLYQWYKNGIEITGETNSTLRKFDVQFADSGGYVLKITNTIATQLILETEPVQVHVAPALQRPEIEFFLNGNPITRLDSVYLGTVSLGEYSINELKIKNTGSAPLIVSFDLAARVGEILPVEIYPYRVNDMIMPGDSIVATVKFSPQRKGQNVHDFYITSNDPDESESEFLFYEFGIQPSPVINTVQPNAGIEGDEIFISGLFLDDDSTEIFFGAAKYVYRKQPIKKAAVKANPSRSDTDGDGLPDDIDEDDDNDGISDLNDNCSLIRNSDQADLDRDGKGDVCDCQPADATLFCDGQDFYTSIKILVPTGAQSGPLRVRTSGGEDISETTFSLFHIPTQNATLDHISYDERNNAVVNVVPGDGQYRLLVFRKNSPPEWTPTNEIKPTPGDVGEGQTLVLADATNSFRLTVQSDSTYFFKIFEYSGQQFHYLITNVPLYQFTVPPPISAPTLAASAIVFSNVTNNMMTVSVTPGNGEKRVILMKELPKHVPASDGGAAPAAPAPGTPAQPASAAPAAPAAPAHAPEAPASAPAAPAGPAPAATQLVTITDGAELTGNANFTLATEYQPGWKVIYTGSDTSVHVTGLLGNYEYEVTVIEYNGSGASTRYLNSGSPSAIQSTLPDVFTPTIVTSNITFINVLSTSMQVNLTPGNGEQRLVVLKAGVAPAFVPADNAFYSGDLGNGERVVYNGNGSSFNLSQLLPDTQYFVTLFEFNTDSTITKYLTAGIPVANQRTLALPLVYVTTPANGAVNQSTALSITAKAVTGASEYTIAISPDPDFNTFKVRTGARTLNFDSLQYGTMYYTQVRTNLRPDYGQKTTFTTRTAESLAYVSSPANNTTNLSTSLSITSSNVPYATAYTIQLSESPDFNAIAFEATGTSRTLAFAGLKYNTMYYNRVKTNLSPVFGAIRNFTTRTAESLAYVTSPVANTVNVNTALTISSNTVTGASGYTIQLSESSDFSAVAFEVTGPSRSLTFTGLKYNTTYYNRVLTDLTTVYGAVKSFTTRTAESLSYVISPANNAVNTNANLNVTSNAVPGAAQYKMQLSETPDFTTIAFEGTGTGRTLTFNGLKYSTTYYNRVSTDLSTQYGEVRSFTTRSAEGLAYVTSPADGSIDRSTTLSISLNTVPNATQYTIQLSETHDFSVIAFEATASARTINFTGLKYNTTYYNRVITNAELTFDYGPVRSFTTRTAESIAYVTSPGEGAINVNNSSVNISSNIVPGASVYTIQLSESFDFSTIAFEQSSPSRTILFTGLKYNTGYYTRVLTDLTTAYGQVRSFTTRTAESLAYVTSPAHNAVDVNYNVSITSNAVPGALTYTIQLSELPDFPSVAFETSGLTRTLVFSGLSYNTRYYSRVKTDLTSAWGQTKSFTTGNPSLYSYMASPANGATNVNWVTNITSNAVTGATSYTIEAGTTSDFSGTTILKISSSKTIAFQLAFDQTYYVRVKTNLINQWGATRSFTTGNPVSLAYVTTPTHGGTGVPTSVNISANSLTGATNYVIEVNTTEDFTGISMVKNKSSRTINFAGLTEATTYYTRVSTNLAIGQWGPTRSFSTINPAARESGDWQGEEDDVVVAMESFDVLVFGNPFREKLRFIINSFESLDAFVSLHDMTGRAIHEANEKTNTMIEIEKPMTQGVYLLKVNTGGQSKVLRVVRME